MKKRIIDKKAVKEAYKLQGRKKNVTALSRKFKCSRQYIHRVLKERKRKKVEWEDTGVYSW